MCCDAEPVVQFLLSNIQQPKLSGASAAALRRVCVTCSSGISTQLPNLLQLIQSMDQIALSNIAANWLIEGPYCCFKERSQVKQVVVLKHNKPRPRVAHRCIARFLGIGEKCTQVVPLSLHIFPENFVQYGRAVL